jgi:hypothetical protein
MHLPIIGRTETVDEPSKDAGIDTAPAMGEHDCQQNLWGQHLSR